MTGRMTMRRTAGALTLLGAGATVLGACGATTAVDDPDAAATGGGGDVAYADGVYDGPRVTNLRGGYQAQVTIEGGAITQVAAIEAGTDAPESLEINARAVPELAGKVVAAQSADVEHVSGSSYTSPAFLESVVGALDQASGTAE